MKLTKEHRQILSRMARRKECDGPESGPEISVALGHARYWAADRIKAMAKHGLVLELGTTMTGGRCYEITEAGRAALKEMGEWASRTTLQQYHRSHAGRYGARRVDIPSA